jgi:hypothetical protein
MLFITFFIYFAVSLFVVECCIIMAIQHFMDTYVVKRQDSGETTNNSLVKRQDSGETTTTDHFRVGKRSRSVETDDCASQPVKKQKIVEDYEAFYERMSFQIQRSCGFDTGDDPRDCYDGLWRILSFDSADFTSAIRRHV